MRTKKAKERKEVTSKKKIKKSKLTNWKILVTGKTKLQKEMENKTGKAENKINGEKIKPKRK